ncbi:MAG: response regulator [Magnetococcus sp. DMHC-6]
MKEKILIIEDEEDLVTTLKYNLQKENYIVLQALTGEEGLVIARSEFPHLVLLDVMLPGISGIEVCRQLRSQRETKEIPIMMLTAKGEEIDRIVGLELGADDYLVKPFNVRELLLRIRAVLRRTYVATEPELGRRIVFGVLVIDNDQHRVWVEDQEVILTAREYDLLTNFIMHKGMVQSRESLLDRVWGENVFVQPRTVDAHIKRLREKLGVVAGNYIETLRGVGYRFHDMKAEKASL